ncbi:MAG: VWA domain-containing protein [Burkholderiaceae bacterium]
MRFLWPDMLWGLALLPLLVAAYFYILRQRKRVAIRYSSLLLVREAVRGQRFRRHIPPALLLLSMVAAVLAVARPTATVKLPSQYMTVALAMDVSRSMQATDVEPTRISAAQVAAKAFIEDLPGNVRLGIVSFAGTANVVQTPTDNKQDMLDAIDRFQLQRATATGSGLILALAMLFPEEGIDIDSVIASQARARGHPGGAAPIDRARKAEDKKVVQPAAPGSYGSGVIILLSDGRRTAGPDPIEVAKMAAERGVRVYTVGFGTLEGTTISMDNYSFYVRLDEETLKAIAKITGGEYFQAGTGADLRKVYANLSTKLSIERKETEVSALLGAAAALFALIAAMLSVLWFHRGARPAASV